MISIIVLVVSLVVAYNVKLQQAVEHGLKKSSAALSGPEKLIVWILSILNPVTTGAVFYYVWKKLLPNKARSANFISMWVFLVYIIIIAWLAASGTYWQYLKV